MLALRSENRRVEQYTRSLDAADHLLHTADQTLGEATNGLFRIKEIGIRSINGANTANDLRFLGDELASIRDFVRNLANTRTNNRYIFGGFISQTPPYDNANNFVGDTNTTRYEVGDGELVDATIVGGSAFGDGTLGTIDIFDNITQLETHVRAGDVPNIETELQRLENGIEQMIQVRQRIGMQMNRVDGARSVNEYLKIRLPESISELRDVDFPKAVSDLSLVENTLQATLAASSRLMKGRSLLDYM